ncbi:MAG TPA: T9SS type A sorting domain-containing protein [Bacteroidetes bacterium]|nr:T9SS type A sorting domain-containing protein [Bacteroidota bacterium]
MKTKILFTMALICSLFFGGLKYSCAQPQEKQYYEIDITGQITHSEYGSPISNHKIYIISDTLESSIMNYYKEVTSDDEGFYHDTITTTLTHGTLLIYTYDYYGEKQEDTIYFRFLDATNYNVFISNFSIFIPYQSPLLQARFLFQQTAPENKLMYSFQDITKNENIISWAWDFGDGTVSTTQNPMHSYPKSSTYKIKLTVKAYVNNHVEINSLSQYLYIADRNYYHLGGHCFADHLFPIDVGIAYLFRIEITNQITPIDTTRFDTLGYYYFYQIPEGNYYVKTQPSKDSKYFGKYIPTYYGDNIYWEEAKIIKHDHTDWEYDVHLLEGLGIESGTGNISGAIVQTISFMNFRNLSIENVDIILYDASGYPMTCTYSDNNGEFNLANLPLGTYYLGAEIAGVPQHSTKIELTEGKPDIDDIVIDLNTGDVTLDIAENGDNFLGTLYPNPATNQINCSVKMAHSENVSIDIINLQGQIMSSEIANLYDGSSNRITVNTSGLENGVYLIRVKSGSQVSQQRFVVSR